jgi:hypothetical protein
VGGWAGGVAGGYVERVGLSGSWDRANFKKCVRGSWPLTSRLGFLHL